MTLHLQIIGRNSEIPCDAFQRLGIATGLAPSVLPLGPSMPLALFHSGAVPGSAPGRLGQSQREFRAKQSHTPVNRPEWPAPPSEQARADRMEVLVWIVLLLAALGVGRVAK